jgi:pSer/pThr/pTyr-binding forkhead associated (FHA) protein
MSFLIQRSTGRNLTLTQINTEVLRIGRGTNQELRSENPAVALEHAVIESDSAGYLVTDKGSITGTYVNKKPVESARIGKGDVVEIGDLRIEVQMADPARPLFLRVVIARTATVFVEEDEAAPVSVATPGARVVKARKFDYAGAYRLARPWMTKVSATAILLIVALTFIGMVIEPQRQAAFMPGGLSSAHATARPGGHSVADNCGACHSPWKSVSSSKCLDCHPKLQHAVHEKNPPDCFSCHAEHRGATKLAEIPDDTCRSCHANLGVHMNVSGAALASLRFAQGRYPFESIARVRDFGESHPELVYPKDTNTLRFNHKLHLQPRGIFNATGKREVLQCANCHALAPVRDGIRDKVDPVALDFEQHCQRCHRLTFDDRYPNEQVPHGGDNMKVYGAVFAASSGAAAIVGKPAAEVRRILSTRAASGPEQQAYLRKANFVFRDKCRVCHEIRPRGEQLAATPPVIPTTWLASAGFTHGRHRTVDCETCHQGVRESVQTSDVLMPRRADCTTCHSPRGETAQAGSSCRTCHEYHLHSQRPVVTASLAQAGMGGLGSGGRMLQGILLAVIVILLLVVLLPVGIALFQRLRPERNAPAPPAPPKPAPPPRRGSTPDLSTDRVPRQPAAAPPDIAASDATFRMEALKVETVRAEIPKGEMPKGKAGRIEPEPNIPGVGPTRLTPEQPPEGGAGTEMVQWNGMLHCTGGALEGQRFIIEDEGFYIGRDPALAKVVIPDSRISKRHVRIVPRDGRVWAIDQGSTNGTFLKDQRITEVQLKRGDTLILGDNAATFVYQI